MKSEHTNNENVARENGEQIGTGSDEQNRKSAEVTTESNSSAFADAVYRGTKIRDADNPEATEKNGGHATTGSKPERRYQQFERGIRIVRIKERHGQLRKAVPVMPLPVAVGLCLVNCILPGIGTFVSGFTVFCGSKTEIASATHAFWLNVAAALLQIVTLPIVVGWIWSIIWGVTFITSALNRDDDEAGGPVADNPNAANAPQPV